MSACRSFVETRVFVGGHDPEFLREAKVTSLSLVTVYYIFLLLYIHIYIYIYIYACLMIDLIVKLRVTGRYVSLVLCD